MIRSKTVTSPKTILSPSKTTAPPHMTLTAAFLVTLLVIFTGPVDAAAEPYFKLIAGVGSLDDGGSLSIEDPDFAPGDADADYGSGFAGGFAFGADFDQLTFELDYLYRSNEFDRVTFADGRTVQEGNYASVTIGANAYYRFRPQAAWQPYLGAGLAWVQEVDVDFEENGVETSFETDEFGWQLAAGVRLTSSKRWLVDAQVRWLNTSDITMEAEDGVGTVTADYSPLNLLVAVGWRW